MNEISLEGGGAPTPLSWEEEEDRKLPAGKLLGSAILLGGVTLVAALCFTEGGGRRRRVVHLNAPPEGEGGGEEPPSRSSSEWSEISNPSPFSSPEQVALPEPQDLPLPECSEEDRARVRWINQTLGQGPLVVMANVLQLRNLEKLLEKPEERQGRPPLHPFHFLSTILNDDLTNRSVRRVMYPPPCQWYDLVNSWGFVQEGFMGGVNRGMGREYVAGNLASYLLAFAEEVRGDPDIINRWIEVGRQNGGDWSGLVRYLLAVNGGPVYPNPPE